MQNVSSQRMRRDPLRQRILAVPGLGGLLRRLPRGLREWLNDRWRMRARPRLGPEYIRHLEALFDADLAALEPWLGRPLRCADFRALAQAEVPASPLAERGA
jgi:hypothetical protein